MSKLVALFGGSFNPSTDMHRDIGLLLLEQLHVDEVWYLVSPQNPFKSKDGMASFQDRVAMAQINVAEYSKLVVQDIEAKYAQSKLDGIIETAETLKHLTQDFPDHRFILAIGADNLVDFHNWGDAEYIEKNFPIVVIPRPGYTQKSLESQTASHLEHIDDVGDLRHKNGWLMLASKEVDTNATACRVELELGEAPHSMRPNVVHYALTHHLYQHILTVHPK